MLSRLFYPKSSAVTVRSLSSSSSLSRTNLVSTRTAAAFALTARCGSRPLWTTTTTSSFLTTAFPSNYFDATTTTTTRPYHASSLQCAVRRRRRPGQSTLPSNNNSTKRVSDDDDSDENASTSRKPIRRVTNAAAFEQVATRLIDKVYAALEPLKAINDPYFLSRDRDPDIGNGEYILLDLGPLYGQYTLQVDPEQALVHFQSPISGVVQYYCSLDDDSEWRSLEDGHILEGLLVRDLIRQIKGVPKL